MKNKKTLWITIITILVLSVGGWYLYINHRDAWIPSRHKIAQAMADLYLIDAVAQNGAIDRSRSNQIMERSYHTILNRYNLTKTQYDSIISIYSNNPTEFAALYEDAISILSSKEAEYVNMHNKLDSIEKRITAITDSLRITFWRSPSYIHIPLSETDTLNKKLNFSFKADSLKGGTLTYSFDYTFPRSNKNKDVANASLIVVYSDKSADTCITELSKNSFSLQHFKVEHHLRDSIPAREIKICLIDTKKLKEHVANLSSIKLSYMPYEVTDSFQFDEIQLPSLFAY